MIFAILLALQAPPDAEVVRLIRASRLYDEREREAASRALAQDRFPCKSE